eukprot:365228-Chlamydomonas_euryale.AAC.13
MAAACSCIGAIPPGFGTRQQCGTCTFAWPSRCPSVKSVATVVARLTGRSATTRFAFLTTATCTDRCVGRAVSVRSHRRHMYPAHYSGPVNHEVCIVQSAATVLSSHADCHDRRQFMGPAVG